MPLLVSIIEPQNTVSIGSHPLADDLIIARNFRNHIIGYKYDDIPRIFNFFNICVTGFDFRFATTKI